MARPDLYYAAMRNEFVKPIVEAITSSEHPARLRLVVNRDGWARLRAYAPEDLALCIPDLPIGGLARGAVEFMGLPVFVAPAQKEPLKVESVEAGRSLDDGLVDRDSQADWGREVHGDAQGRSWREALFPKR